MSESDSEPNDRSLPAPLDDQESSDRGEGGLSEIGDDDLSVAAELIEESFEKARDEFGQQWGGFDLDGSMSALRELHGWKVARRVLNSYREWGEDVADESGDETIEFVIDSFTLADFYRTVTRRPDVETLVLLTGLKIGPNRYTVNRVLRPEHQNQSPARASSDPMDSAKMLIELDQAGYPLVGYAHNHTTNGVPGPSGVDSDTQRRLESLGYDAIGLILSPDGYVRVYSEEQPFEIEIHGNNVRELREHVYRLDESVRQGYQWNRG